MITRDDFLAIIDQTSEKYDLVAALRKAGDPRYFQHQEAIATMFAMLSQQIEVAMMEPFDKVRDATVLAEAALKGIVPKATCARVKLLVKNANKSASFRLEYGRRLSDSNGLMYEVESPVTIPAAKSDTEPGVGYVDVIQRTSRVIEHTVSESTGFYSIEVPPAEDGRFLAAIQVKGSDGVEFKYTPRFTNISAGDRVFHVEADEYQRITVKFGIEKLIGFQPSSGDVITLILTECDGLVSLSKGSPFTLEYAYTPADSLVSLEHFELLQAGSNPMALPELRELCKYPSIYDDSAVFLGEFEYLVRRKLPGLQFLSIWNEQIEEQARGPSSNNINSLFVAFEASSGVSRAETKSEIQRIISTADDSLRIVFVETHVNPVQVSIEVTVARVHDQESVKQQVRMAVLKAFGIGSEPAKKGMFALSHRRLGELLKSSVSALNDDVSDFKASISSSSTAIRPEQWSFVSESSLTVNIISADYNIGGWGR